MHSVEKNIKKLKKLPNVIIGFSKDRKIIPSIIKQFDIGIIPYNIKLLSNKYCYPMKIFEYFYLGKPVISTPIKELKNFPEYVKIGNTIEEWKKHIEILLSKPWPEKYERKQKKLAIANSWSNKINTINKLIFNKDEKNRH